MTDDPSKRDFTSIANKLLIPSENSAHPEYLHGTPAKVIRILDHRPYVVHGLYYDGDKHGFVVMINNGKGPVELYPGEYRTTHLHIWNEDNKKLEISLLS